MASQIRSKQPRPLSIITESCLDDYAENYFQNETADDVKEPSHEEKHTQPSRQVRRISVAPLEHPVIALGQEHLPVPESSSQDNSINCRGEGTSNGSIDGDNSHRKPIVSERLSCSGDSVDFCQIKEQWESRQFSENDTCSKHLQRTGDVLPSTHLADHYSLNLNEKINNGHGNTSSTSTDQPTNSKLVTRTYKDIRNDIRNSGATLNHSNSSDRCSREQRQIFLETGLKDSRRWAGNLSEAMTVSKAVENTDSSTVESGKVDENEILNKEQQAWRSRVRKSSSFTFSSVKARPLRRSVGSYDFKNSSFLARNERRSFKKGDSTSADNSGNQNVKFYLSSDDHEDLKDMIDLSHDSVHNSDGQEHPRELSFGRNYSWHGLYTIPRDPIVEQSGNHNIQSRFSQSKYLHSLPNLGKSPTNQQPQIKQNKSDGSFSYPPDYKKAHSDSQSNNVMVRRLSAVDQSDFRSLEALATRLNLPTRRLSTTIWREKYLNNTRLPQDPRVQSECGDNDKGTKHCDVLDDDDDNNNKRLHDRLALVRDDLVKMRLQDQDLARQFMKIRHQMLEVRLAVECQNYMELLDDAQEDVEEERKMSRMVDVPLELLSPHYSLLHVGLTRMNLASRRFSTC